MALIVPRQHPGSDQLLFKLIGANMNVTTDQVFDFLGGELRGLRFLINSVRVLNASTSLTTAVGGIYDTASKGGNALVANSQAYSALTGATLGLNLTLAAVGLAIVEGKAPILSLTTPQGGAATADFLCYGRVMNGLY